MNPQARRIDAVLMASPAHAMAFYVRPILLAGYERLFFERDANSAEEPAHHRSLDLDPALSPQSVAKSLQGDVGFLGSQRFEKLIMRLKFRRRYPPILLAAREPLRSKRCTHLITEASLTRYRAAALSGSSLPEPPHRSPGRANPANTLKPFLLASAQPAA
jgi:hypothetical protein